jgi:replicative superfamily II helicase
VGAALMDATTISVSEVVFREDLYPRIEHDPRLVQKYAEDLDVLPPIEVNQHYELIDGWHRWTAYRKIGAETIPVIITQTKSDVELLSLAIERNAKHGQQLTNADKRKMAIRLFNSGAGVSDKAYLAKILSVSQKTINRYLKETEDRIKADRDAKIFSMYLSGHTQQEIADAVGVPVGTLKDKMSRKEWLDLDKCPKSTKIAALFEETLSDLDKCPKPIKIAAPARARRRFSKFRQVSEITKDRRTREEAIFVQIWTSVQK